MLFQPGPEAGPDCRRLAALMRSLGAKLGASKGRHQAPPGHVQRLSMQVNATSDDARRRRAMAGMCFGSRRPPVRIRPSRQTCRSQRLPEATRGLPRSSDHGVERLRAAAAVTVRTSRTWSTGVSMARVEQGCPVGAAIRRGHRVAQDRRDPPSVATEPRLPMVGGVPPDGGGCHPCDQQSCRLASLVRNTVWATRWPAETLGRRSTWVGVS